MTESSVYIFCCQHPTDGGVLDVLMKDSNLTQCIKLKYSLSQNGKIPVSFHRFLTIVHRVTLLL